MMARGSISLGAGRRRSSVASLAVGACIAAVLFCVSEAADLQQWRDLNGAVFLPLQRGNFKNSSDLVRRMLYRHGLRRRLANEARMWLYGHVLTEGYYYTMLGLGTPAQEFALIVDTGSTVTYVPCKSCTHCGKSHQDNPYSPSASSTYEAIACEAAECPGHQCGADNVCSYSRHYAEDSTSAGIIASDLASFGLASNIKPTRILFGCETTETGDLYTQRADGIIGMGRGALGIMNQLARAKTTDDQFSLCYGGMERGGGSMIVGAVPVPPKMEFTPLENRPGEATYYNVQIQKLLVEGKDLQLDSGMFNDGYGSVMDSGTTFTYLPAPAFEAVKKAITAAVTSKGMKQVEGPDPHYHDVCFGPATEEPTELSNFFPKLTFVFKGPVNYELDPENYLFRHTGERTSYCLGLFENKDHGTLLGGILVRNTMVTYDRTGGRVGLWKTNCSSLFQTLTAMEGGEAPPLPKELMHEPPADVPPSTDEKSNVPEGTEGDGEGMTPLSNNGADSEAEGETQPESSPAPADGKCDGCAARLEIVFRVSISASTFGDLKDFFIADVSRELSIDMQQVADVTYASASAPPQNADGSGSSQAGVETSTDVHFSVVPAQEYEVLTADAVKRIQGVLQNAEFSLRDAFGEVTLQSLNAVPPQPYSPTTFYWYIIGAVGVVALLTIVVAIIMWRRKAQGPKLVYQGDTSDEKAALAEPADAAEHERLHEAEEEDEEDTEAGERKQPAQVLKQSSDDAAPL